MIVCFRKNTHLLEMSANMRSDKKRTAQVTVLLNFFVDDLHIHMKFLSQTRTAQKFMPILAQKAQADTD